MRRMYNWLAITCAWGCVTVGGGYGGQLYNIGASGIGQRRRILCGFGRFLLVHSVSDMWDLYPSYYAQGCPWTDVEYQTPYPLLIYSLISNGKHRYTKLNIIVCSMWSHLTIFKVWGVKQFVLYFCFTIRSQIYAIFCLNGTGSP